MYLRLAHRACEVSSSLAQFVPLDRALAGCRDMVVSTLSTAVVGGGPPLSALHEARGAGGGDGRYS
eukprot:348504-Prymnesium_polylepis.2